MRSVVFSEPCVLALATWLLCLVPARSSGDTIVLKSGTALQGIVKDLGAQIEVRIPQGTVTYRKDLVSEIRKGEAFPGSNPFDAPPTSTPRSVISPRDRSIGGVRILTSGRDCSRRGIEGFLSQLTGSSDQLLSVAVIRARIVIFDEGELTRLPSPRATPPSPPMTVLTTPRDPGRGVSPPSSAPGSPAPRPMDRPLNAVSQTAR